jgi:hypothetical protein
VTLAPKRRFKLDVLGIAELDVPGPTTPNVALLMASPDQTPSAREIVMSTVRLFGERLFRHPNRQLLKGYAFAVPIPDARPYCLWTIRIMRSRAMTDCWTIRFLRGIRGSLRHARAECRNRRPRRWRETHGRGPVVP